MPEESATRVYLLCERGSLIDGGCVLHATNLERLLRLDSGYFQILASNWSRLTCLAFVLVASSGHHVHFFIDKEY
jgi:hypothetical protein